MKILIIDDHTLFSKGLGKIIKDHFKDLSCTFSNSIANITTQKIDIKSFDLIISDIDLPGEDIFEFLSEVKNNYPSIPILIISMHNKLSIIRKCRELKIKGYILKDDHELVITAMNHILEGKYYYSESVMETLSLIYEKEKLLTPKEEEIIYMVVRGKNNHEIAKLLFISYYTVKTHRKNIYRKLGITKTCEIVDYYNKNYL